MSSFYLLYYKDDSRDMFDITSPLMIEDGGVTKMSLKFKIAENWAPLKYPQPSSASSIAPRSLITERKVSRWWWRRRRLLFHSSSDHTFLQWFSRSMQRLWYRSLPFWGVLISCLRMSLSITFPVCFLSPRLCYYNVYITHSLIISIYRN
jgi:hypothetical protein